MKLTAKYFDQLSTTELYEILKARAEIFVVEQNCVYQDLDGIDYRSLHVFYEENGKVLAYLRAFEKETKISGNANINGNIDETANETTNESMVQMGRVLTLEHGKGLGGKLLKEGIRLIKEKMQPKYIYIEAQCYATGYYEREGFRICSEEFLEDGIPHMQMMLEL